MYQNAADPNKEIRTSKEKDTIYKNIVLVNSNGRKTLKLDKALVTYKVTREIDFVKETSFILEKKPVGETIEPMSFDLVEVTEKEVAEYRRKKIPSFLLKVDGKLYHAVIPNDIKFLAWGILGAHMCAKNCCKLSPASDAEGGCAKVRNYATYIERYPWITKGYETFATKIDSFVAVECAHYEKLPSSRVNPSVNKEPEEDDFSLLPVKNF